MKRKLNNFTKKKNKGFTIVELLVVITIIGVLSSFVSVGYFGYVRKSKEAVAMAEAKEIYQALELCLANGVFGSNTNGVPYEKVSDLDPITDDSLADIIEDYCGLTLPKDASFELSTTAITYTNGDITVTYSYS